MRIENVKQYKERCFLLARLDNNLRFARGNRKSCRNPEWYWMPVELAICSAISEVQAELREYDARLADSMVYPV